MDHLSGGTARSILFFSSIFVFLGVGLVYNCVKSLSECRKLGNPVLASNHIAMALGIALATLGIAGLFVSIPDITSY
jgi:hypothetical protein